MSFRFHFQTLQPRQIVFGYSPAQEALTSLHVLVDSKRHPLHVPWVVETRRRISPALKAEVERFAMLYQTGLPVFWLLEDDFQAQPFHRELERFEGKPVTTFTDAVLELVLNREVSTEMFHADAAIQDEFFRMVDAQWPASSPLMRHMLDNPAAVRNHFIDFLATYWEVCIQPNWDSYESMFLADIERRRSRMESEGPLGVMRDMSPEVLVDDEREIALIVRSEDGDVTFEASDQLLLNPSLFSWPRVFTRREKPTLITYPVFEMHQEGSRPVAPDHLLKLMRAAGDMTRLQILQLLSRRPRSTQELSGLLELSEPAISKHLKVLQDADMVVAERASYYVFYHVNHQPFDDLTRGLNCLLTPCDISSEFQSGLNTLNASLGFGGGVGGVVTRRRRTPQ